MSGLILLSKFLVVYPFVLSTVVLDRFLNGWVNLGRFSSVPFFDIRDVWSHPQTLFDLIKAQKLNGGVIPDNAEFVSLEKLQSAATEPLKFERTVSMAKLTYRSDGKTTTLPIFIKIATGRPVSSFIKAITSTFAPQNNEVFFFSRIVPFIQNRLRKSEKKVEPVSNHPALASSLPFPVPNCLYAARCRLLDRVCLVWTTVDNTEGFADAEGIPLHRLRAQVANAAALHAATWGGLEPVLANLQTTEYMSGGLAWLDGIMSLYRSKLNPLDLRVWDLMNKRLKNEKMCFSHADCRYGNMIFFKQPQNAAPSSSKDSMVMVDWEASSVTPFMWDCTYAMVCALDPDVRREHHRAIIRGYLANLQRERQAWNPEAKLESEELLEQVALKQYKILLLVVRYFGLLLDKIGGVGEEIQGNSKQDMEAWTLRVREAALDGMADPAEVFESLGLSAEDVVEYRKLILS